MSLEHEAHMAQRARWPAAGRHVLAQFNDQAVVVYQAYRPAIGAFAATHGWFGGEFSLDRMSWLKPNFLWMMYRSGWGTKEGQEVVLAVHLRRDAFEAILGQAVHSSYVPELYASRDEWQRQLRGSCVRLQWDPDHGPGGAKLERRAIQLGLRGEVLRRYAREWILEIEDISAFVHEQRIHVSQPERLVTPREAVYRPADPAVAAHLGIEP